VRRLLATGAQLVTVSRGPRPETARPGVIQVAADVAGSGWHRWCAGCTEAVHLAGIIRETPRRGETFDRTHRAGTESVLAACREHGIDRLVHVSALGVRGDSPSAYLQSKWRAEEAVRRSGLKWTIVRPSLIFGPGSGFFGTLARAVRRLPVFPIFGSGTYLLQPIAVEEVGAALVTALEIGACEGEVVELGGPEAIPYVEVVRRTAAALGLRRSVVHVPEGASRLAVRLLAWSSRSPITPDQLAMLLAGSHCDTRAASLLFDPPRRRYEGPVWLKR